MAEITESTARRQRGSVHKRKKKNIKVDLTPMVDLGFLLITFFVFTTSLARPVSLKLILPAGDVPASPAPTSTVLTVIPVSGNRIFYFGGGIEDAQAKNDFGLVNYSGAVSVGDIIRKRQTALQKSGKFSSRDLTLIIQPAADARYENVVAVLDKVLINDVKHYALVDIDAAERRWLQERGIK